MSVDQKYNLYILTTEDPLYTKKIIQELFLAFPDQIKGVGFTNGLFTLKRVLLSPLIYGLFKYCFLGFTVIIRKFIGGKIENLCKQNNIQVDHFSSVKDGSLLKVLEDKKIDLLISVNCSKKLYPREFLFPTKGTINIHNSDLPKYGGLMPILHAIRNGETQNGVCIHFINEEIDRGDIIMKEYVEINKGDTLFSVWERCVNKGAQMLPRAVLLVLQDKVERKPNKGKKASYFSFPSIKEIFDYRRAV